jgi:cobalt-zinc-cadmium efflux system membrane fusion protein
MYGFFLKNFVISWCITFSILNPHKACADAGHSHAPVPVAEQPTNQTAELRLAKTGKEFEIVLTVMAKDERIWTVYISDSISNRPIGDASVTLMVNGDKSKVDINKTAEPGVYQKAIPVMDVTKVAILVKKQNFKETFVFDNIKLSAKERNLHATLILIFIISLLAIIGMIVFRKHLRSYLPLSLCLGIVTASSPACYAHGGEDHSHPEEAKKEERDSNQHIINQTSSGLVVPKEIQFHLSITTEKVTEREAKGTIRLTGHVISDPSGYARLQATQNARVMNDPDYPLPLPGQYVQKGQVILVLQPTLNKVESTDQKSTLYKIESEIVQIGKEVDRKEKLGQFASQKELENARSDLERAVKQQEEIINKTFKPEYLKSPLDGIVADLHVRPGEIVSPDKTIVEIVDPSKLLVEAFIFDPTLADDLTGGIARLPLAPDKSIRLKLIGVSPKVSKEDQAVHVLFKAEELDPSIKMDMAVEVLGDLRASKLTLMVPSKAIVEFAKGSWVFIHTAPEVFEARKVRIRRTVERWADVEEGLALGERIVVEGAYLLNQAR